MIDTPPLDASPMGEMERFWLIVQEPGLVPTLKGAWPSFSFRETIRDFIKAYPTAYLTVLTVDSLGQPHVEHGPEALQMADGRSMSVGRRHNARTLGAHNAALSTPPDEAPARPLPEGAAEWLADVIERNRAVYDALPRAVKEGSFSSRENAPAIPSPPPPDARMAERERVARIIDPQRWALIDHWKGLANRPDLAPRIADNAAPSLAKADAILATRPDAERMREALEKIDEWCCPVLCQNCADNRKTARTALTSTSDEKVVSHG